jgi:hypothetical protein
MEGIVWNFCKEGWVQCFFWVQNFALWQQKVKSSAKCTKGFYSGGKKKSTNVTIFLAKKFRNYHIFTMSSWRSPEQSRIL